jgi:uncharacterized protein (TIGR01777 family)
MLAKLTPLFRYGLGGSLGKGDQMVSWISMDDLLKGILFCLTNSSLRGPVNFVSPHPVSQKKFTSILAKKLHRPAFFSPPSWLLHLVLGEQAKEMLLASQEVLPEKLLAAGFSFLHPHLESALEEI